MELELLHDFIFHARWKILFWVEESTRGENMYVGWECVLEVTLSGGGGTQGENMYVRWECVREMRMCMWGENMCARWLWGVEVTFLYRIDVTSIMTKLQMMKIPRVWPYIVQSHLAYLAWGARDDIEVKVILHPHVRWLFFTVKMLKFGLI